MSGTILVRGARQLLTLHGPLEPRRGAALSELGIIRDGALLIEDGRIIEVGPSRRIENLAQSHRSQEMDAAGRVVMPGFVDCHTHLVWEQPSRESDSDLAILRNASAKRLEARALQFIAGMVRHGTTTLEASSGYGFDQRSELKILRVHARLDSAPVDIASTYLSPHAIPAAFKNDAAAYLSWMCAEMLPAIRRKSLARFVGLRHECPVFDMEQARRYLQASASLGFRLKVYGGQSPGNQAIELALEAGAHTVDHVPGSTPADLELLARSDTIAVLLPGAPILRGGDCGGSARALIDSGAAVALGSNFNPRSRPSYSMQTTVSLACAYLGLSAAEAICAATYNAACAIGSERMAGSLEAGKPADFIVMNAADYREIPEYFGVNLVHRTVKRGVTIYQEGRVPPR